MDLRYNPGLLNDWRDKSPGCAKLSGVLFARSQGSSPHVPQNQSRAEEMERRLDLDHEDPEALTVRRHPEDELEAGAAPETGQKIDTMHTRRLMVEQLEAVERSTGYKGLEAMEILSERKGKEGKDWSVAKFRKAGKRLIGSVEARRSGDSGSLLF